MSSKVDLCSYSDIPTRSSRRRLTKTTLEVVEAMELNLKNVSQGFLLHESPCPPRWILCSYSDIPTRSSRRRLTKTTLEVVEAMELNLKNVSLSGFLLHESPCPPRWILCSYSDIPTRSSRRRADKDHLGGRGGHGVESEECLSGVSSPRVSMSSKVDSVQLLGCPDAIVAPSADKTTLEVVEAMELNLKNVCQGFFSTSSMPSKVNLLQLLRMSRRDRRAVG